NKAPGLLEVALDALFMGERPSVPGNDLAVDIEKTRFRMELAKRARRMFFNYTNQDEVVLEFVNLINVLELVIEDVDWDRTTDSLLNLKAKIIGGDERAYSFKDFDTIMGLVREAAEISFFNNVTYRHFEAIMASSTTVDGISIPNLPEYSQFSEQR